MGTCPECGTSSRVDPDAFTLTRYLEAKPLGTFSLSGATMKVSAMSTDKLECRNCGWIAYGRIDDATNDLVIRRQAMAYPRVTPGTAPPVGEEPAP